MKTALRNLLPLLVFSFLCLSPALRAQEKRPFSVEWIYSDEGEAPAALPHYVWTDTGDALIWDLRKPEDERTLERLDPETGRRTAAVDGKKALGSLRSVLEDAPDALSWPDAFDRAGRRALYLLKGDLFLLDLGLSSFQRVTSTREEDHERRLGDDPQWDAFVALMGGDFRSPGHGLLVVGGLDGHRVPSHRRVSGERDPV